MSLALLNLMLTDSNEDSLLARIERRREQGRGGHGPPLYLSRPLIRPALHVHIVQCVLGRPEQMHHWDVLHQSCLASLMNIVEKIKNNC